MASSGTADSVRWLVIASVGIAATFIGTTAVMQYRAARIDAAADEIAHNTSPSIEHLAAVRGEVREIQFYLSDYVDSVAAREPADRAPIDASLKALDDEIQAYVLLPNFADERLQWASLQHDVVAFDSSVRHVLAQVDAGAPAQAQNIIDKDVAPNADRLIDTTLRIIRIDAAHGRDSALAIERMRRDLGSVGIVLAIACAVLSVVAALLVSRNIRRSQAVQRAYSQLISDRADELELFSGRVAHDVASPLFAARMGMDLAGKRIEDPLARQALESATSSLLRVSTLVDGLLAFARAGARPEPGAIAPVHELVQSLVAERLPEAERSRVQLRAEGIPEVWVACSAGVFSSMLANLLENALRYSADVPAALVTVRVHDVGGRVRVEVEDTGPGVPPHLAHTVFDPYVRGSRKGAGLGLGLATVKRLAERHGGAVGLRDRPEHGSMFWFELPKAAAPAREEDVEAAETDVVRH